MKHFYDRVRALREERGLSESDLPHQVQMHRSSHQQTEEELLNLPVVTLVSMADFYGTSVDYLLGLTDEKRPYPRKTDA